MDNQNQNSDDVNNHNQDNSQNQNLNSTNNFNQNNNQNECNSKVGIGVVLALFGGLIGLIVGLLLYKEETYERQTFMKGWLWTFIISTAVSVIISVIFFGLLIPYGNYY